MYGYVVYYVTQSFSLGSLVLDMWLIVEILFTVQYVKYVGRHQFQNLLRSGAIIEGLEGIDLRYFQSATVTLTRSEQRTWDVVMRWLFHTFHLDYVVCDLRLSCLANRAPHDTFGVSAAQGNKVMTVICMQGEEERWDLVLLAQAYAKPIPVSTAEQKGGGDTKKEV